MSELSKINLYGEEYTIKDSTARTNANNAQSAANSAQQSASSNTTKINSMYKEIPVITYDSSNESINIAKGITLTK